MKSAGQKVGFIAAEELVEFKEQKYCCQTYCCLGKVSLIAARRTGRIKGGEKVLLPEEHVEFEEELNRKYGRNQAKNVD